MSSSIRFGGFFGIVLLAALALAAPAGAAHAADGDRAAGGAIRIAQAAGQATAPALAPVLTPASGTDAAAASPDGLIWD